MAEAVGLGASILTFIVVATKLSSATATLYRSIKDAPSDVRRVQTRLGDLEFILSQINRIRSRNPECVGDPVTESYWADKEAKLRSDFAEFGDFAAQLAANIGKAKGKSKWLLSHSDRARKDLGLLAEDIDILRTLLRIMESNTLGDIYRAQLPVITTLAETAKILNEVNTTMVTKQEFSNTLHLSLKPSVHAPQSTPSPASDFLTSSVAISYANYYLPLGRISLSYGWRSRERGHNSADEESSFAGQWDFDPASWVSLKSIRIQARLLVQFGERSKPRITPNLTFRAFVSRNHPVWKCIKQGDLVGVRGHLDNRSVGVNDTTLKGQTLLQAACDYLLDSLDHQPTRNRLEILKLLVELGADGEVFCTFRIGPEIYFQYFRLQKDRRTAPLALQSTSLSPVDILLNAGADLSSLLSMPRAEEYLYPCDSLGLGGYYHDRYTDYVTEFLLDMLSRDVATLGRGKRRSLQGLLVEICSGRSPELWDAWREGHAIPVGTVFSPGPVVDEIASMIMLQCWPERRGSIGCMLNTVFRTGDIDAGKDILSLFIKRSPDFAASLGKFFSWDSASIYVIKPLWTLGKNSDSIQELLEGCGADPNCLMYYGMASVPEILYWEEVLEKGVDDIVLNSLLLFCAAADRPPSHVEYLLARGASVNFRSIFGSKYKQGWTALAYAAWRGREEMVMLLLNRGADVLQEFVGIGGGKKTISQIIAEEHGSRDPDFVRMLAQFECKERGKRGTSHAIELECPEPQPKQLHEHGLLALGVFLMALVAIHHLLLQSLGWCLRNRRLLLWVCGQCYKFGWACMAIFAWVPLVGWAPLAGLAVRFFLGIDLGVVR